MAKLNEMKIKLIKIDGVNILYGKGKLETDKNLITEKIGKLFRAITTYKVEPKHIKREKRGKAVIGIDLKTHKSIDLATLSITNLKCQNCLEYLIQKKNWEARQKNLKYSTTQTLIILFAGMGLFFLVTQIIGIIMGRV